jgi:hypothetical protein
VPAQIADPCWWEFTPNFCDQINFCVPIIGAERGRSLDVERMARLVPDRRLNDSVRDLAQRKL